MVGLPADLEASRRWRDLRAEADAARQLAVFEGQESVRLAGLRDKLVRARLTEITNAGLGLTGAAARTDEGAKRQATARELEGEAAGRRQAEREVPGLAELRSAMTARMQEVVAQGGVGERTRQLAGVAPPAGFRQSGEEVRRQALAQYDQTRRLQIQRLSEARAALLRGILDDTRRGVMLVAFRDHLRLHLIPTGEPVGENLTAQVREKVRAVWAGEPGLMKVEAQENYTNENRSLSPGPVSHPD